MRSPAPRTILCLQQSGFRSCRERKDGTRRLPIARRRWKLTRKSGCPQQSWLGAVTKGRVDEAIAHYQEALQIRPDYEESHFNLGDAFAQKGKLDEAISQYRLALQSTPITREAHNNLGNRSPAKGGLDEAIMHFQEALQFNPNCARSHDDLGIALPPPHPPPRLASWQRSSAKRQIGRSDRAFPKGAANQPRQRESPQQPRQRFSAKGKRGRSNRPVSTGAANRTRQSSGPKNNLAWLLATCPEASLRNGNKAVELARTGQQADRRRESGHSPHPGRRLGRSRAVFRSGGNGAARLAPGRGAIQRQAGRPTSIGVETLPGRQAIPYLLKHIKASATT